MIRIGVNHKNTLWTQRPVDHAVGMGVSHRVGHLSRKVQPCPQRECAPALAQVMIQTDFIGFTTEEDSRTEFVLVEVEWNELRCVGRFDA